MSELLTIFFGLKNTADFMIPIYISLFDIILDTGVLPDSWLEGIIRPIYKRKLQGNPSEPENYRPITILSCFSKLVTAVLNLRGCIIFSNKITS